MIVLNFKWVYPDYSVKVISQWFHEAYRAVGEHWKLKMLPRHFDMDAYGRYHLQRRSHAYNKRKMKKYGHIKPLVYTGNLRTSALLFSEVRTWPTKAVVRISGPAYTWKYHPDRNEPDKAEELKRSTEKERRELSAILTDTIARLFNTHREHVTKKVA